MKDDPVDPDVGRKRYCVRDVAEPDLGIREFIASTSNTLRARGCGELWTAASAEIQDRIDLEDHVGETVATVTIDVDAWEFRIDWEDDVDPRGLVERTRDRVARVVGRGSA